MGRGASSAQLPSQVLELTIAEQGRFPNLLPLPRESFRVVAPKFTQPDIIIHHQITTPFRANLLLLFLGA